MDNLPVTNINADMARIRYQIAWFCVTKASHICPALSLLTRSTWQADAKILVHTHDKARAVSTICQACSAIHIRVPHKLQRKISNLLPPPVPGFC